MAALQTSTSCYDLLPQLSIPDLVSQLMPYNLLQMRFHFEVRVKVHVVTLLREVVCEPFSVWVTFGSRSGSDGEEPEKEGGTGTGGALGVVARVRRLAKERAQGSEEVVEGEGDEQRGVCGR